MQLDVVDADKIKLTVKAERAMADECTDCDLCVVKKGETTLFSCKAHPEKSCSYSKAGYSVFCEHAEKCNNE